MFKQLNNIWPFTDLPENPKIIFTCLSAYQFLSNNNIMNVNSVDFVYAAWKIGNPDNLSKLSKKLLASVKKL
jgi:hypothetical protein